MGRCHEGPEITDTPGGGGSIAIWLELSEEQPAATTIVRKERSSRK